MRALAMSLLVLACSGESVEEPCPAPAPTVEPEPEPAPSCGEGGKRCDELCYGECAGVCYAPIEGDVSTPTDDTCAGRCDGICRGACCTD